jgi:DNA modification methylase
MDLNLYFKNGKPRKNPKVVVADIVQEPVSVINIEQEPVSVEPANNSATIKLLNGDCLELMKDIPDKSIDLIFCDLPYGQTSCKWDCPIDLDLFWIQVMRIKKLNTPIFMTTTTKFGVSLINSAPKKCQFRYDIVWVKSAPAGFLLAKKMPMRKHEMVYVFYEKLPFYDLSSHQHKFIKEDKVKNIDKKEGDTIYGENANWGKKHYTSQERASSVYDPPLPTSMLEVKSTRGKHSTEKPVALMEWIFKYYSKPGDTVFDPTCGSGSTGVACKNMNRNFIGIEKDKAIYEGAKLRLEV